MPSAIRRLVALAALLPALLACTPTADQQAHAFQPTTATLESRARQTRLFDTTDRTLMLQSAVGVLQDLGFTIEESQVNQGVIVASKLGGGQIRAQVLLSPAPNGTLVRATFQHIIPRPGAMLPIGETLSDPGLYQGFFEKLAQSAFLTAHEI